MLQQVYNNHITIPIFTSMNMTRTEYRILLLNFMNEIFKFYEISFVAKAKYVEFQSINFDQKINQKKNVTTFCERIKENFFQFFPIFLQSLGNLIFLFFECCSKGHSVLSCHLFIYSSYGIDNVFFSLYVHVQCLLNESYQIYLGIFNKEYLRSRTIKIQSYYVSYRK